MVIPKKCLVCGGEYTKKNGVSSNQWAHSKYCSLKCNGVAQKNRRGYWKGKKRSDETKAKLSEALKGRYKFAKYKMNKEIRKKISDTLKRKGIRPIKPFLAYGRNHPCWKGTTPIYKAIRNLKLATKTREKVLERDNNTCLRCGDNERKKEVHHKIPFAIILHDFLKICGDEPKEIIVRKATKHDVFWDTTNLETLCVECHNKTKRGANAII